MRTHIRLRDSIVRKPVLAIALAIGALVASSTTAQAQQDNGPVDPGVRCAAKIGPGEYEFYLPGAKVKDVNGNTWVCGPDGMWFKDYSAAIRATTITIGGLSFPTSIYTPKLATATTTFR